MNALAPDANDRAAAPALELQNVTKFYGEFKAVDDISLTIPTGMIYGFLGPNGAGKTTVIRMILDVIRPTQGKISILGHDSALKVRRRIGYLPEEKGLYKKMKAWAFIAYFATLKGLSRRVAKQRACELLKRYGLGEFTEARTEALSKGMGQKVQLLAAVAHDPEFVILDEPFSGLDPVNQNVMEEVIREMARRGRTVLFSTHVMQHAERLCDRILLIARGRKIFDGTVAEARRLVPRRVRIETEADISPLRDVKDVECILPLGAAQNALAAGPKSTGECLQWEIRLKENANPQEILQACFSKRIPLRSFNHAEPTLHEVFMQLVGPDSVASP